MTTLNKLTTDLVKQELLLAFTNYIDCANYLDAISPDSIFTLKTIKRLAKCKVNSFQDFGKIDWQPGTQNFHPMASELDIRVKEISYPCIVRKFLIEEVSLGSIINIYVISNSEDVEICHIGFEAD